MARNGCKLLSARSLLQKPAGLRWFDFELEGTVGEGSKFDLERDITPDVGGHFIELLAEFHHVDTKRTK
jgi:hypothetical protein